MRQNQTAILAAHSKHAKNIAAQMGIPTSKLCDEQWIILFLGTEAIRGRRFDLVLITDDAYRELYYGTSRQQQWMRELEARMTPEGKIVQL